MFHIHYFRFKFKEGANKYYECRCSKRKVIPSAKGYTPINTKWLFQNIKWSKRRQINER